MSSPTPFTRSLAELQYRGQRLADPVDGVFNLRMSDVVQPVVILENQERYSLGYVGRPWAYCRTGISAAANQDLIIQATAPIIVDMMIVSNSGATGTHMLYYGGPDDPPASATAALAANQAVLLQGRTAAERPPLQDWLGNVADPGLGRMYRALVSTTNQTMLPLNIYLPTNAWLHFSLSGAGAAAELMYYGRIAPYAG